MKSQKEFCGKEIQMPKTMKEKDDEFKFEIVRHLGVIARYQTGWSKEINIVSWRDGSPKLDIRDWDPDHERMSKGLTMRKNEVLKTLQILTKYYGAELENLDENCECEQGCACEEEACG